MVNPVDYVAPEDDPDRTRMIPRFDDSSTQQIPRVDDQRTRPSRPLLRARSTTPPTAPANQGRHRKKARKQPLWRELLILFSVAILLTIVIQTFIGRVYSIPSGSMEQTLHGCPGCDGDRVLVDKLVYRFNDPAPGDVVVFRGPTTWTQNDPTPPPPDNLLLRGLQQLGSLVGLAPPDERDFVKRVIAVGGQTVECCDNRNRVLVDGRPIDEPYIYWAEGRPNTQASFPRLRVPDGSLWVLGDNRNDSCDSRCQGGGREVNGGLNGVVPVDDVIGKARYIVLPPSRWRGVGDHNPQATAAALGAPPWQQALPAGVGLIAAWPLLWLGRRIRRVLRR